MSAPKKKSAPAFKQPPPDKSIPLVCRNGESQHPRFSELMASPEMAALRVIRAAEGDKGFGADLDLPSLQSPAVHRVRTPKVC